MLRAIWIVLYVLSLLMIASHREPNNHLPDAYRYLLQLPFAASQMRQRTRLSKAYFSLLVVRIFA
jgi:hypothetical protein